MVDVSFVGFACAYILLKCLFAYKKKLTFFHPLREAGDVCFVPLSGISGLSFVFPLPVSSLSSPVALFVLTFLK